MESASVIVVPRRVRDLARFPHRDRPETGPAPGLRRIAFGPMNAASNFLPVAF